MIYWGNSRGKENRVGDSHMATVTTTTTTPFAAPPTLPSISLPEPPGDDVLYEVVDNQIRELPPMGAREVDLASTLIRILSNFAWSHQLGRVESEMLFLLDPVKNLQRRPDLALVSYERWPRDRRIPAEPAWEVVPNLAIEVISPKNLANDVVQKIEDYFKTGAQRVWVIYPNVSKVYEYDSPSSVRILTPEQSLEGGTVLPGLQVPLKDLLENGAEPE
jgi:Uma2 family endonuclease